MAHHLRFDLPGIAQHIVQRGNNRQACFASDADYGGYLWELAEAALKHSCAIHAYVLMTNEEWGRSQLRRMIASVAFFCQLLKIAQRRIIYSLNEATGVIEQWQLNYNQRRPHSSLGCQPQAPQAYQAAKSIGRHFRRSDFRIES